jgi:hypothetical protein
VVPPGQTAPLTFRIDLRQQCIGVEPKAVRDAKIRVTLGRDSSATEKPVSVELRGRVKTAVVVEARSVDFGRFPATAAAKTRVIPVRSLIALRELAVSTDGAITADLKSPDGGKWELHVRPNAALVGRYEASVKLTPTTAAGEVVPAVTIPVAFDVLHDIQPDSPFVPLGTGRVGETLRGTFTVSSLSNRPFAVPTCEVKEGSVRATAAATAPHTSYTFEVERKVAAVGNHTCPVIVRGVDAAGLPFEFRTEAQWYGVMP